MEIVRELWLPTIFIFHLWNIALTGIADTTDPCGQKPESFGSFIIGGKEAKEGAWPWQVSMQFEKSSEEGYEHVCGAVLITDEWLLTAAHCADKDYGGPEREDASRYRLLLGAHNITDTQDTNIVIHTLRQIIKHPGWENDPQEGYPNDIAMLQMKEKVTLGPRIGTACMPSKSHSFIDDPCYITGWGVTTATSTVMSEVLMEAGVQTLRNTECEFIQIGKVKPTHICSFSQTANACVGDSGGPLSCQKDGQWYAAGVSSWGQETCPVAMPTTHTRVGNYSDWVRDIIESNPGVSTTLSSVPLE